MSPKKLKWITFAVLGILLVAALSGCAQEPVVEQVEVPGETIIETVEVPVEVQVPGPTITFWSFENQPARAEKTQEIIADFRDETGINVELVLIDQTSMNSIMASNYAAGTLPDVVFVPVTLVGGWYADGILDAEAATAVVENLNESTFSAGALSMVGVDEGFAAVPSDGWGQLLIYRTDLFDELGLEPPTDYDKILTAAKALEENGYTGIMAGTDPGHSHTESTYEQFALANGVKLMDDAGNITLDTLANLHTVELYTDLMMNYGPKDTSSYWLQTRASYFAGEAGMVSWSPFILDEMAGLVNSTLPNCPQCAEDPAYLAKNSGIVTDFSGPDGGPAQYGKVNYMGITTGADTEAAKQFVEYWLDEGYLRWLGVAAEGKFPMRSGTVDNPNIFVEGWGQLDVGVDTRAPLADFYTPEALELIAQGANNLTLLGIEEGQAELLSAIYTEMVFPRALGEVMQGYATPQEAVEMMQSDVEELQAALSD
jgi:multiple sugar transport system substrate-binding protein